MSLCAPSLLPQPPYNQSAHEQVYDRESVKQNTAVPPLSNVHPPFNSYDLDLSKPYDYMVARVLLDVANKREGCEITNVEHAAGEVSNTFSLSHHVLHRIAIPEKCRRRFISDALEVGQLRT